MTALTDETGKKHRQSHRVRALLQPVLPATQQQLQVSFCERWMIISVLSRDQELWDYSRQSRSIDNALRTNCRAPIFFSPDITASHQSIRLGLRICRVRKKSAANLREGSQRFSLGPAGLAAGQFPISSPEPQLRRDPLDHRERCPVDPSSDCY